MKTNSPLSHGAGISRGVLHYLESSDFWNVLSQDKQPSLSVAPPTGHLLSSGAGPTSPPLLWSRLLQPDSEPQAPLPPLSFHRTISACPFLWTQGPPGKAVHGSSKGSWLGKSNPCECHSCSPLTRCLWKWFLLNWSEFELTRKVSFRNTTLGWGRWSKGEGWG